jgi:hypothetical protein
MMAGTSKRMPEFQVECEEGWADQLEVMERVAVAMSVEFKWKWIKINASSFGGWQERTMVRM